MKMIIVNSYGKKRKTSKQKKLSPEEKQQRKLQRSQEREIRLIFKNLGFDRVPNIDGKSITFDGRSSEMDDIFVCENIILLVEYTITNNVGDHLTNKSLFYNKINENKKKFIQFLTTEPKLTSFKEYYDKNIKGKYSGNQLKLEILYCSYNDVGDEYKNSVKKIIFFDYYLVQYFKSLTKAIKKSGKYEFLDYLNIPFEEFGENILESGEGSSSNFLAHILPEEKSDFEEGIKIVSFYIDAHSLMKRSYVLRQEGWRDKNNIGYYQRMLDSKKLSSMRKYLSEKKRVFINNIIATVASNKITLFDNDNNILRLDESGQFVNEQKIKVTPARIEIKDESNIIGLIDGQHRTYAYHEGDDQYESKIEERRKIQNLLVTGIIFPSDYVKDKRLKFQATIFNEINSTQSNVNSQLKQEIELMISPFSSIAIGKKILEQLNLNGPFKNKIEQNIFDKGKLKTASVVSFGLRPLIKIDAKSKDTLYNIWQDTKKHELLLPKHENYDLRNEYINFCTNQIRNLFIAFKYHLKTRWSFYNKKDSPDAVLNVTFFNGVLNVLRLLIENDKLESSFEVYSNKLSGIENFSFKNYTSSQYRKLGIDIYNKYFN